MKWRDLLKLFAPTAAFSWFSDIYNGRAGKGNSLWDNIYNRFTGAGLTGSEREANQFSHEEAQNQRDWEEEMRNTSFQAQAKDMQAAGLNLALMYGGAGSSGATVPSSSAPTSVSPQGGDISTLLGSIMDMALLGAQKENIEADTAEKRAGALEREASAERTKMLTPAELDNIVSQIDLRASEVSRNNAQIAVDYANVALLETDLNTRSQFNEINLKLQEANLAKTESERDNILQSTENLKRDFALSFAREAAIKAEAGLLSQQTKNALVEHGILKWNEKASEYEAGLTEYNYDHADGNRIWNRIATGASVLRDAGIAVGAVVGGAAKGAAKGATETITNTAQNVYNAKGKLVKTVITNQNRNK